MAGGVSIFAMRRPARISRRSIASETTQLVSAGCALGKFLWEEQRGVQALAARFQ